MAKKQDLSTGRGIGQAVRDTDREVGKEGSYLFVDENGERVYWPDTARTLPKPVRERVVGALMKLGILTGIVWAIAAFLTSL